MTPIELKKSLTMILSEKLADTGFVKKSVGNLIRKVEECEQYLSCYFTRDRGLPGDQYSLSITLSFRFAEVDQLTSDFLGETYRAEFGTAARPLYTMIPNGSVSRYRYCSDEPLEQFAEKISEDFRDYAALFYNSFDTLCKLETYFEQEQERGGTLHVVRTSPQGGRGCCIAAVYCVLKKWDRLWRFLEETDLLSCEQRERIEEFISNNS